LLFALKEDARSSVPKGARSRVLARLGVGVAAGAAASAHATAAAGKVATTSTAPVAGAAGLGLAKLLVAHPVIGVIATLAVGSGVGIGAYRAIEPGAVSPPAVTVPKASTTVGTTAPVTAPAEAPPHEERRAPEPAEPSVPPRPAPTAARPHQNPHVPALAPAPDLPSNAESPRLSEQQALLDQARTSLRRGDGGGALAIATEHARRYPVTEFAEERGAIEILALVMLGRSDEARSRVERFEQRYPTSLFLPSIRGSLEPSGVHGEPREHE
ncbi:MAG TPA: hypothetical protein VF103_16845, partial [Polyangiaceae bacterium]